jgi:hypothetical protein
LSATARDPWGFSLFCDDVRFELGGKMSIMGIYQADMIFAAQQTFPIILPKFGIFVKYYEMQDTMTNDILVRVFLPSDPKDAPSVTLPFNRTLLAATTPPRRYELEPDQERVFNLTYPIVFSPLVIKQEGFVKVRAVCGEKITNLGSLMIRRAHADENIQLPDFGPGAPTSVSPPSQ